MSADTSFRLRSWLVRPALGRICSADEERHIRPRNMDALVYLAQRAGRVVSKNEILDGVWGTRNVAVGVLSRSIAELRQALGDDARQPRFIETIPKRGYCLVAQVAVEDGSSPALHHDAPARETEELEARYRLLLGDNEIALAEGANIIGRTAEATVRICHSWVSRQHARVLVDGPCALLEDLGSKNGTFLGGRRLEAPMALVDGDEFLEGSTAIVFRDLTSLSTETCAPDTRGSPVPGGAD